LGFGKKISKKTVAKEIMSMALIGDGIGNVYFNEVLFAAMKRAFGQKILKEANLNLELQLILNKTEQETRKQIEKKKIQELVHPLHHHQLYRGIKKPRFCLILGIQ
jgi:formamidopyrimidine-DNA glycosylase